MNWNKLEEVKPTENGNYLVVWLGLYSDSSYIKTAYFHNNDFIDGVAGGERIIYWSELPEMPDDIDEYRNKIQREICKLII